MDLREMTQQEENKNFIIMKIIIRIFVKNYDVHQTKKNKLGTV